MVKCVVSGCPNREVDVQANLGIYNRKPKRFFCFPRDPARVKVWLAALRETHQQNPTEQRSICEDHFLPEDITADGVNGDAIPIMPPCLDGALMSMIGSWGGESSDDEDQWASGGGDEEEEEDDAYEGVCAGFADAVAPVRDPPAPEPPAPELPAPEPPAVDPSQQESSPPTTSGSKTTGDSLQQRKDVNQSEGDTEKEVSICTLVKRFLEMMLTAPDGLLDIRQVLERLQTRRRRVHDVTNVLLGINLIEKQAADSFKWTGQSRISSFLWRNEQMLQRDLDGMKLVEDTLDGLIKSCAQQLFDMTDDAENAALAYVTHEDFSRLRVLQEQTLFVVKAPEETKLKVPAPRRDNVRIHLKAGKPIAVLTCDVGTEDATGETSGCFSTLEESRIKTATLHTESSRRQSAVQSA